ncbi:MAG: primosomal protein N' [Ignavibacteriales bacterium]|nr:primosomal protein N' [Ignavibacteriales bacterium]
MKELFADIAVPLAIDNVFTYRVPTELQTLVEPGIRVTIPFGKRSLVGIIIGLKEFSEIENIKSIKNIIDVQPILPADLFKTACWMAEYYFSPLGEVLKGAFAFSAFQQPERNISCTKNEINPDLFQNLDSKSIELFFFIKQAGSISVSELKNNKKLKNLLVHLKILSEAGLVNIEETSLKQKFKPKYETVIKVSPDSFNTWHAWLKEIYSRSTKRGSKQIQIIQTLIQLDENIKYISIAELLKKTGANVSTITSLEKKNIIQLGKREVMRIAQFEFYESALGATNVTLNNHQQNAFELFKKAIDDERFSSYLLHGITGSGKTQVYIEAIKHTVGKGKSAIVLVPEISLTPQIVRRFKYHLGENVVVMHSRMSGGERFDAWRMARQGKTNIVIGPRSAIFAPLKNVGLIVVDEEHEASYKQFDQTPRYHARDVALVRASFCNAVVILGSATPSLESYTNALNGKHKLVELPERADNASLPEVRIIDIGKERKDKLETHRINRKQDLKIDPSLRKLRKTKIEFSSLTDLLNEKINDRLKKKEGIILLQNRRGFAPYIECPECGYVEMCDNCNISLTYHDTKKHLRCHYCGFIKMMPIFCPKCNSIAIQYRGFGTQRIEVELTELFPNAKILRMDLDTTSRKGAHDALLKQFGEGKADILLGTQMVAKGLDFARVTLVGVISADTQMLLPDFRSTERTFQLLTQVAGRAGRSNLAGEVVIQTLQPNHSSLKFVALHDYKGFYEEEISFRKELNYPPYSRIILVEFKGRMESDVINSANAFNMILKKINRDLLILGPAPAAISKLQGEFRWHLVLKNVRTKDPAGRKAHETLRQTFRTFRNSNKFSRTVKIYIDVDPVGMM